MCILQQDPNLHFTFCWYVDIKKNIPDSKIWIQILTQVEDSVPITKPGQYYQTKTNVFCKHQVCRICDFCWILSNINRWFTTQGHIWFWNDVQFSKGSETIRLPWVKGKALMGAHWAMLLEAPWFWQFIKQTTCPKSWIQFIIVQILWLYC